MPTQIIDTSLHVAAFPPGYTGPGNLIGNSVNSIGKAVFGNFTSSTGNAVQINCGFAPMRVDVFDITGVLSWTWQFGMPVTNTIKNAAVDATSAIVVATGVGGTGTVTLSTGLCGNAKNICYSIQG